MNHPISDVNQSGSFKLYWFFYAALIGVYVFLYAPYGFENNDSGFILGLAHQLFLGDVFYDHILYVRPPGSPGLHQFVFYYPFAYAPVFADRVFFYIQIGIYSALSACLVRHYFAWTTPFTVYLAACAFVFSVHGFPSMGWHTVDGIFFSVIALFLYVVGTQSNRVFLMLAACSSLCAALCKQPFLLTPVLLVILSFTGFKCTWRMRLIGLLAFLLGLLLLGLGFSRIAYVPAFVSAVSMQTTVADLFNAGVFAYLRAVFNFPLLPIIAVLFLALLINLSDNARFKSVKGITLLSAIWLLLLLMDSFYARLNTYSHPLPLFNALFVMTLFSSMLMWAKTRLLGWLILVAMHGIAWMASISWGCLSPILYSAPSLLTLGQLVFQEWGRFNLSLRIAAWLILPFSLYLFYQGNRFLYSLEGPELRQHATASMESVSPVLRWIRASPAQLGLYREIMDLIREYTAKSYVVLPNMPIMHVLTGSRNPLGIDWVSNAEVGDKLDVLTQRLNADVDMAFIYKQGFYGINQSSNLGSQLTQYVISTWKIVKSSSHFMVFVNPAKF